MLKKNQNVKIKLIKTYILCLKIIMAQKMRINYKQDIKDYQI
jgi:hypothetical protein